MNFPRLLPGPHQEPLKRFFNGGTVWEGDRWLAELRHEHQCPHLGDMPEHGRLLDAAVEHFPGADYWLHLIPAGKGLPRPQEDMWVVYAPGRASESVAYRSERQARRALYATVVHEALVDVPFQSDNDGLGHRLAEKAGITDLTHVVFDRQVIGFGGITSHLPGNRVVFGLMNGEPFAVNLTDQPDDTLARQILTERLGGVITLDWEDRPSSIQPRRHQIEPGQAN